MNRVNHTATRLADDSIPAVVAAEEMNTLFSDCRIFEILHVYSEVPAEMKKYENELADSTKDFYQVLTRLENLPMTPTVKSLYAQYQKVSSEYDKLSDEMLALSRAGKTAEAIAILNGRQLDLYNQTGELLDSLIKNQIDNASSTSAEGDAIYSNSFLSLVLEFAASVIISILVTVFIVRGTLKQLGKDPGELAALADRVTSSDYDIDDGSEKMGVYGIWSPWSPPSRNIFPRLMRSPNAPPRNRKMPGKPCTGPKPQGGRPRPKRNACSRPPTGWKKWRW